MQIRRTVLFLIPHLGGGGAERIAALVAGGLPQERYCVHFAVLTQSSVEAGALPEWVTVHTLGAKQVRAAAVPLLRMVWRLRPELIFSGIFHLNFLVLLLRPLMPRKTRCVVRQNGLVTQEAGANWQTRLLYRLLYPRADAVICQTETMAEGMRSLLGNPRNLHVLANPVLENSRLVQAEPDLPMLWRSAGPRLVAVGRLTHAKGFDLLLTAFAEIVRRFPAAELAILGRGEEEATLKQLSHDLRVEKRVHFAGYVRQPQQWFQGASLFVLSSRYEGMSNALLEAAAEGLPIVAMPEPGGVAALMKDAPGTWVSEEISAEALARAVCTALRELQPEQRFAHAWLEPFHMHNAMARYEELFEEVLAGVSA